MDAAAIVLAGGASRRMGCDKALLDWNGRPLIQHIVTQLRPHFDELLISAAQEEHLSFLNLPIIVDAVPDQGPLEGLRRALAASGKPWNFVMACDMPHVPIHLVAAMHARRNGHDCVAPRVHGGMREPLFAFYHQRAGVRAEQLLHEGNRSLQALLDACDTLEVDVPRGVLMSANTPEEYRKLPQEPVV